jgi:hypothetical protein
MTMVEVVIDSVRVSLMSPQRLVVLRQVDADRFLPVWVGPYEAEAITVALQEIEIIRPLTHDLLKNIFTTFNAKIQRIEIVSLRDTIFYGNIVVEKDGQIVNIDARASDSIALAVRAHVPIMVDRNVMHEGGIAPENDIADAINPPLPPERSSAPAPRATPEDSSRLSIFEDFINKLDRTPPPEDDEGNPKTS